MKGVVRYIKVEKRLQALVTELTTNHGFKVVYSAKGCVELEKGNGFVAVYEYENRPSRIVASPCATAYPGNIWTTDNAFDKNSIINKIKSIVD